MLLGEHRRRDEHQRLLAVQGDRKGGAHGDLRLAEADVAADEPVHRARRFEVLLHGLDRALLILGLPVRELGFEALQPVRAEVEGVPQGLLTAGVEREELARELTDGMFGPGLEKRPRLAAELRERRGLRFGSDVARHLADLLVRHVEPVVAAKAEEEVVARDARNLLRLEAEELADSVVLVDDEIAAAQVGERLQRSSEPGRVRTGGALAEDLRVREEDKAELAPDEAPACRRDREEQLGLAKKLLARLERARLHATEQIRGAQRVTAVREGDHDAVPAADERAELVLRLAQPAGGNCRALGLEGERLAGRKRIELRSTREPERLALKLLVPDLPHLVRLEDEIGWPG